MKAVTYNKVFSKEHHTSFNRINVHTLRYNGSGRRGRKKPLPLEILMLGLFVLLTDNFLS